MERDLVTSSSCCNEIYKYMRTICNESEQNCATEMKLSLSKCKCETLLDIFFKNCKSNNNQKNECIELLNLFTLKCISTDKYY